MASSRTRQRDYAELVALWLKAHHGLPLQPKPWQDPDGERGHIRGLPDVVLNAHAEVGYLPGQQVDTAREAAAADDKGLYFSVQFRKITEGPGNDLVFTDLQTLGRLLQRLQEAEERATA
jgi:hypothetical protein